MLAERIDRLLPQTQCGQCGYPSCRPYAEALAAGAADINQCPPGGDETIVQLAALLGREIKPVNPANGVTKPPAVARIDESRCIGCVLCINACPVDAIVGANQLMHTVIAAECTGCELCVAPCPVDCIEIVPIPEPPAAQNARRADLSRARFEARTARLQRAAAAREEARRQHKAALRAGKT